MSLQSLMKLERPNCELPIRDGDILTCLLISSILKVVVNAISLKIVEISIYLRMDFKTSTVVHNLARTSSRTVVLHWVGFRGAWTGSLRHGRGSKSSKINSLGGLSLVSRILVVYRSVRTNCCLTTTTTRLTQS
jgi:hypothetical protein